MVLLVGAALFVRSLASVLSEDAGFDRDKVLVVATDAEVAGYSDERLSAYYAAASRAARRTTGRRISQPVDDAADQQRGRQLDAEHRRRWRADGGGSVALCVLQRDLIGLLRARWACACCADATSGSPMRRRPRGWSSSTSRWRTGSSRTRIRSGAVISIGRSDRRRNLEIVGLVQDAKYQTLQEPARRIAYLPITQENVDRNLFAEVRPIGRPSSIVERIRSRRARDRRRRAGQDRDRDRSDPRVARQGAGHGAAGFWSRLHGTRPGLRRSLRSSRLRGVPTGEGDRIATRARRHARGRALDRPRATA